MRVRQLCLHTASHPGQRQGQDTSQAQQTQFEAMLGRVATHGMGTGTQRPRGASARLGPGGSRQPGHGHAHTAPHRAHSLHQPVRSLAHTSSPHTLHTRRDITTDHCTRVCVTQTPREAHTPRGAHTPREGHTFPDGHTHTSKGSTRISKESTRISKGSTHTSKGNTRTPSGAHTYPRGTHTHLRGTHTPPRGHTQARAAYTRTPGLGPLPRPGSLRRACTGKRGHPQPRSSTPVGPAAGAAPQRVPRIRRAGGSRTSTYL